MQTFDKALFDLYQAKVDQLRGRAAHRRLANDLRLNIKLEPGGRQPPDTREKSDLRMV